MADTDVGRLLDRVAVVAGAFDDAGVGPVTASAVQMPVLGDLAGDLDEYVPQAVRGKTPPDR
jgi:hypothetical protein